MTTPIVPTVTDELIAQLAALANADPQGAFPIRSIVILALLAHIADLKQSLADADAAHMMYAGQLAELKPDAERRVPLYEAVERACGELPDGWQANICMENGAGWIELYDDCGVLCDWFPTNNERLDYTLNDAIDAARSSAD